MMKGWEGFWYLSEGSIQQLLGERLPIILEAFTQVKAQLGLYLRNPSKIDLEEFVETHKASMIVALQVDGLAQTSLQIQDSVFTLFTVVDGESVTKTGRLQSAVPRGISAILIVEDDQDGEQSSFIWKEERLSTVDQGVEMVFARQPTFFFTDPELDVMEQLLEWIQSEN